MRGILSRGGTGSLVIAATGAVRLLTCHTGAGALVNTCTITALTPPSTTAPARPAEASPPLPYSAKQFCQGTPCSSMSFASPTSGGAGIGDTATRGSWWLRAHGGGSTGQQHQHHLRGFFSLGGSSGQLQTHRERRVVGVPPDLFFSVVADVEEYKNFLPFCVHSRVLQRPSSHEMIAEMGIGFRVFREDYTSRVVLDRNARRIKIKAIKSPTFTTLTSSWSFQEVPGKADHTAVDFTVEFGVSNPLLQSAVDVVFNDVTRQQVKAFEAQCRKVAAVKPMTIRPTQPPLEIEDREVACVVNALSTVAPQYQPGIPDVAALLEDRSDCLVAVSVELSKANPELSCSRGFALLAADPCLRRAVCEGLSELILGGGSWLGKASASVGARGRSRVEVLGRALHLLLTDRQADERAGLIFCMADFNGSGRINQAELERMLQSHLRVVSAAVPWLMEQSNSLPGEAGVEALQDRVARVTGLLRSEVESEVPAAVAQIFADLDQDSSDDISAAEWELAWRTHPELVDLMSLEGMNRMVHWATVSSSQSPAQEAA